MISSDANGDTGNIADETEDAMESGYEKLAADPEYKEQQERRKLMRGVVRRRSAVKMRWPDA